MTIAACTLDTLAEEVSRLDSVHKRNLSVGDWVEVTTRNSVYSICALGERLYSVSGGWFDQHRLSPATITINGCTLGGRAIKHDIVAAPGLFLEFGNGVVTTRIQHVRVVQGGENEPCN